jgi:glyoxylase-like metal-dependent hydrolase (beta-lactamase superfamily II)
VTSLCQDRDGLVADPDLLARGGFLRKLSAALLAFVVGSAGALAQSSSDPHEWKMTASSTPIQVSPHVWVVQGFPVIAFVVGTRSVLVVDTGLGPKMGAIAAGFAAKLAPGKHIYLTTTHFHPEHAGGDAGFPADTTLIRNDVQEEQVQQNGMQMVAMFAGRSAEFKDLLAGATFRHADITFHDEAKIDLGGVVARLMWLGGAHTEGDELTLVEPDATLISGDVVQNATMPGIFNGIGKGGTPTSWLHVLDKLSQLHVAHVVPDHSETGDGSLVAGERNLIAEIRTSAIEMQKKGVDVNQAGEQISAKLKQEHPDWRSTNAAAFVKSVYEDPDKSVW